MARGKNSYGKNRISPTPEPSASADGDPSENSPGSIRLTKNTDAAASTDEFLSAFQAVADTLVEAWTSGDQAIIDGLVSRTDLNSQRVTVSGIDKEKERVCVSVPSSGEVVKVKPDKLTRLVPVENAEGRTQRVPLTECLNTDTAGSAGGSGSAKEKSRSGGARASKKDIADEVENIAAPKIDAAAQNSKFPSESLSFDAVPSTSDDGAASSPPGQQANHSNSAPLSLKPFSPPRMFRPQDSAISWAFSASVPGEVRRAVSIDDKNWKYMAAPLQWNYLCMHIAYYHHSEKSTHFMIQDNDGGEGLLLSLCSLPVRECPVGLGLEPEHFRDFHAPELWSADSSKGKKGKKKCGNPLGGSSTCSSATSGGDEAKPEKTCENLLDEDKDRGVPLGQPPLFCVKYAHTVRGKVDIERLNAEMNLWVNEVALEGKVIQPLLHEQESQVFCCRILFVFLQQCVTKRPCDLQIAFRSLVFLRDFMLCN